MSIVRSKIVVALLGVWVASSAMAQLSPSDFETPEFYANWGLNAINAQDAYAKGFTGAGVKVGIADSAVQLWHPEFRSRVYFPDPIYVYPVVGYFIEEHGTHVTGIAAAARNDVGMMGVAFDATIASVIATSEPRFGFLSDPKFVEKIVQAGVQVVNNSYGAGAEQGWEEYYAQASDGIQAYDTIKLWSDNDIVIVYSAGNQGDKGVPVAQKPPNRS